MLINKIHFPNLNYTNFGKQNKYNNSPKLNAPLTSDVFIKSAKKTTNPIYFTGVKKTAHPNYNDTEKFAEYLEAKIASQLKDPTEKDIKKTIDNVSKKADISEDEALEIVSRLTQFSNYSQLGNLEDSLMNHNISHPDLWITGCDDYFGINDIISYLNEKKTQLHFSESEDCGALFIDKPTLKYIKENKRLCHNLIKRVKSKKTSLVLVDGWCAESNGKNLSHGLFGGPLSIEDAAVEIGKEIKNGKSLDKILNGNIIKEAKEVFGEDVEVEVIKNEKSKPTVKNITERLQSLRPDKKTLKDMLNAIVRVGMEYEGIEDTDENKARTLLAQYFDEMISCFSSESMTEILKTKYKQIEKFAKSKGKTMDDVIYIIPNEAKSFGLVAYQYANVNNVDFSQMQAYDIDEYYNHKKMDDKIFVILDDVVGSGASMLHQQFSYQKFLCISGIKGDKDIIISPISALKQGVDKIKEQAAEYRSYLQKSGNKGKDIVQPYVTVDYKKLQNKIGNKNFMLLAKLLRHPGYKEGFACTAMPYGIPDNDSAASGFLLNCMLNDDGGNKSDYYGFDFYDYMPIKDEVDEFFGMEED